MTVATPAGRPTYGGWLDQIAETGRADDYGLVASAWLAAKANGRPKLHAPKGVNRWLSEHPPPGVASLQATLHALVQAYHDQDGLPAPDQAATAVPPAQAVPPAAWPVEDPAWWDHQHLHDPLAHDGFPVHWHDPMGAVGGVEQPEQAPDQAQQQPGSAAVRPQHPASAFPRPDQASQWPDGTTEVNQRVDGSWDVLDPAGWRWAGWWAGDAWTDQQPIQPPDLRQQQPDQGAAAVYYPEPVPQQPGWPAAEVPWEPEQPADQAPEHPYQVVMIMLARIENELLRMTQALAPLIALAAEAQAADAALAASQLAQPSAAQQRAAQIAAEHGWTAGPAFAQQAPGGPQAAPAAPPDFYGGHVVAPPDFAAIAEASDGREDES